MIMAPRTQRCTDLTTSLSDPDFDYNNIRHACVFSVYVLFLIIHTQELLFKQFQKSPDNP